jgi:hypothetical protein
VSEQLVSEQITVDAPPAVVFAILADPRQHSRIDGSGSVGSVLSAPERLTARGQRFTARMKLFANGITDDAVVGWATFPERNRQGITDTLRRLKQAAEAP